MKVHHTAHPCDQGHTREFEQGIQAVLRGGTDNGAVVGRAAEGGQVESEGLALGGCQEQQESEVQCPDSGRPRHSHPHGVRLPSLQLRTYIG